MNSVSKYILVFIFTAIIFAACKVNQSVASHETIGSIDPDSGLVVDTSYELVKGQCTACHSAKLVTMNRFTREGWKEKITWMQKTQNLWDLGEAEPAILDYLTKHYSPEPRLSRRSNLENVEWFKLNE
jgi:hypothetical protein